MTFPQLPSGLAGLLTDLREFVEAVRFARPGLLWLLLVLPVLALVDRYAVVRRRRAAALIGRPGAVAGLRTDPRPGRRWLGLLYPLGWVALVLGLAGPRWGTSDSPGVAVGRDVVVVIDLSKSMLAQDLSTGSAARWEAARDAARDLLDHLGRRGGHRVAVVAFAARPKLLVPLTTDTDHARAVLDELDGRFPPPECRPGAADTDLASGTRIGAALAAAVAAHDPRFPGSQDIVLISDGDDPADDREWAQGADAARAADIPVHTVGVGNAAGAEMWGDDGPVHGPDGAAVVTRLNEPLLKQLAAETRGEYLSGRGGVPALGEFYRTRVEPHPSREVSDDAVPQPKERYPWFLAPAAALFAVGWLRGR
ncbi:MAG: VWA domain-containing protein [Gemmataceae bacterium]|nr:VWA domain-containing protein [Gemmataceae bacterium]